MEWREKLSLVSLCLVLIAWGLEFFEHWSVLVAHLTPSNWMMIALFHSAVLLSLIGVYARAPKGTPARWQALQVAVVVIITWAADFSLMGKIGGH
jgi:hypothetical protein